MTPLLDRVERVIRVLKDVPSDTHAVALILMGVGLALHGNHDEASLVIGGGLAILKGHPNTPTPPQP